jgi:hypothetical protein
MSIVTLPFSIDPWERPTVPEKLANEPSWLPVTFEPVHSIFEFCGVIAKALVAPAPVEAGVGTADDTVA